MRYRHPNLYADKDLITGISFNFNRKESDLNCFASNELKEQINNHNYNNISILNIGEKKLIDSLTEPDQGKKLWKLCIILVLLFLGIETLLLRFLK